MFANKHDWHNAKRWSFADPSRRLLKRKTTLTTRRIDFGVDPPRGHPHASSNQGLAKHVELKMHQVAIRKPKV